MRFPLAGLIIVPLAVAVAASVWADDGEKPGAIFQKARPSIALIVIVKPTKDPKVQEESRVTGFIAERLDKVAQIVYEKAGAEIMKFHADSFKKAAK